MSSIAEYELPPLPRPFRPTLQGGGGCGRPAAMGCGCLGLVVFSALLIVQWQQHRLLDWSVSYWQRTLLEATEDGLSSAEKVRVDKAFRRFRDALGASSVPWSEAMAINQSWTEILAAERSEALTFEQILPLIEKLEALPVAEPAAPADDGVGREIMA